MNNPQLELARKYVLYTHRNVFLTGKAGTGKTTFLRQLQNETNKRMIIVAPTGVAAINAGGVTIHSFFQLAPGLFLPNREIQKGQKMQYGFSKHKINILRSLDLLVIDEISMVRCDLLDAIDAVLRRYQNRHLPFGGVQLLMIGDLQQLAPVATGEEMKLMEEAGYRTPYFFSSQALGSNYITIELTTVYRQSDQTFVNLLNNVRDNRLDIQTLTLLNQRYQPHFNPSDEAGYITLTTHNQQAQSINNQKLEQLQSQPQTFKATIHKEFPESSYPTDELLVLKIGAQVMFCKNDPSQAKQFYNGKIGRVIQLSDSLVVVECKKEDGSYETIKVGPLEWQNTRYVTNEKTGEISEEVIGSFTQIPLKTAWAITIHKSQGLTFDRCIINAGRAFSPGQVYVALSRCRTLEGLVLSTPINGREVMSDPEVVRFNHDMAEHQPTEQQFTNDRLYCIYETLCQLFGFGPIMVNLRYLLRQADEHLPQKMRPFVENLKTMLSQAEAELEQVGVKFQVQIGQLIGQAPTYEENKLLQERVSKGTFYFLGKATQILDDFFTFGLPEIGNKQVAEQLDRVFREVHDDYKLKMHLLVTVGNKGFSLDTYWNAKATATMQLDADGQPGYQAAKKKTVTRTVKDRSKPKTTKKSKK